MLLSHLLSLAIFAIIQSQFIYNVVYYFNILIHILSILCSSEKIFGLLCVHVRGQRSGGGAVWT